MSTQETYLQGIADAIRAVDGRSADDGIAAKDFANAIRQLDPAMTPGSAAFENGDYGLRAAKCATTYFEARVCGLDRFAYHTNNIFSQVVGRRPNVRLGAYGRIDCSAYVGLCLRGIPYARSPYALHTDNDAVWTPSAELAGMYGSEGWEMPQLDAQPAGSFNDIGIEGCSSVRFAADLGRYFYKYGYVLYDKARDGAITSHLPLGLQPGDLVFWDTSDNPAVNRRFKSISHVGLVAENTSFYYEATGTEGTTGQDVIKYSQFANSGSHPMSAMVLAVRPDYRPRQAAAETPLGVNLLEFPWTYSRQRTVTRDGLTITQQDKHTLVFDGTSTASITLGLKYYADSDDHITLSSGTYVLSGIPDSFAGSTAFALQVRDASGNDLATPVRYPNTAGNTNTFTLTARTDLTVRLYCSSGRTLSNVTVVPTLIRTA